MDRAPFFHRPVMLDEVVAVLGPVAPGILVDATVGGGGHSAALLESNPGLRLVGTDRDPDALEAARERLSAFRERVVLHHAGFDNVEGAVRSAPWDLSVTAVLFDLGVSSPQLDRPERGFSYRAAGPLDMRMDPSQGLTAADVVNTYAEASLVRLLRDNGEGRFAHRIARAIIAARPLTDTAALAEVVRDAIPAPARRRGGHPAKRAFQAIRIEVNAELEVLAAALAASLALLAPGGRLAVLSYHSGEDRLVKTAMVNATTGGCVCPPGLPCVCGAVRDFAFVFRGSHTPSAAELSGNRRAESARLRAVERIHRSADPAPQPLNPSESPFS